MRGDGDLSLCSLRELVRWAMSGAQNSEVPKSRVVGTSSPLRSDQQQQYGASVISELTQWSVSLTRLASDLSQARQKYVCMVHL